MDFRSAVVTMLAVSKQASKPKLTTAEKLAAEGFPTSARADRTSRKRGAKAAESPVADGRVDSPVDAGDGSGDDDEDILMIAGVSENVTAALSKLARWVLLGSCVRSPPLSARPSLCPLAVILYYSWNAALGPLESTDVMLWCVLCLLVGCVRVPQPRPCRRPAQPRGGGAGACRGCRVLCCGAGTANTCAGTGATSQGRDSHDRRGTSESRVPRADHRLGVWRRRKWW